MGWLNPATWVHLERMTSAKLNSRIKEPLDYLRMRGQAGTITIDPTANTPTSVEITFPVEFKKAPYVIASAATNVPGTQVKQVGADQETRKGCRLTVTRTNDTPVAVRWIAYSA